MSFGCCSKQQQQLLGSFSTRWPAEAASSRELLSAITHEQSLLLLATNSHGASSWYHFAPLASHQRPESPHSKGADREHMRVATCNSPLAQLWSGSRERKKSPPYRLVCQPKKFHSATRATQVAVLNALRRGRRRRRSHHNKQVTTTNKRHFSFLKRQLARKRFVRPNSLMWRH